MRNHHDGECVLEVHAEVPDDCQKYEGEHLESTEATNLIESIIKIQV